MEIPTASQVRQPLPKKHPESTLSWTSFNPSPFFQSNEFFLATKTVMDFGQAEIASKETASTAPESCSVSEGPQESLYMGESKMEDAPSLLNASTSVTSQWSLLEAKRRQHWEEKKMEEEEEKLVWIEAPSDEEEEDPQEDAQGSQDEPTTSEQQQHLPQLEYLQEIACSSVSKVNEAWTQLQGLFFQTVDQQEEEAIRRSVSVAFEDCKEEGPDTDYIPNSLSAVASKGTFISMDFVPFDHGVPQEHVYGGPNRPPLTVPKRSPPRTVPFEPCLFDSLTAESITFDNSTHDNDMVTRTEMGLHHAVLEGRDLEEMDSFSC